MIMFQRKQFFIFLFIIFSLSGCYRYSYIEGNYIFPNKLESLKPGLTKVEITNLLGPATIISPFEDNIWYYIYESSDRRFKFLSKNLIESKVVTIKFNSSGVSTSVDILEKEDRRSIPVDGDSTKDTIKSKNPNKYKDIDSFKG
jgi:outer membrane protein assembly factor BamE (lipoprotein component of BamABCDE complex)